MENSELMQALLDLCGEAGLDVRLVGASGAADGESPPGSAVCRVQGNLWIVLSRGDPVELQLRVLATACASTPASCSRAVTCLRRCASYSAEATHDPLGA